MARAATVFLSAAASLAMFLSWALSAPSGVSFTGLAADEWLYLDPVPATVLIDMKLQAARRQGQADIGVFGSSRSLMAGADDIGVRSCSFFNYSIPGASMRTSVALLEMLAKEGKAPHTALVSLDNLEIGMMGQPEFLPITKTMALAYADLKAIRREPRAFLRTAWRHTYVLWQRVKQTLSSATVSFAMSRGGLKHSGVGGAYRADGSRILDDAPADAAPAFVQAEGDWLIEPLLVRDLQRLRNVQNAPGGPSRVVLYESPLEPGTARELAIKPQSPAVRYRQLIAETCATIWLECVLDQPRAATSAPLERWPDATHPPASVIGPHLRATAARRTDCGDTLR